jgi:hypothetical protein
MKHCAYCGMKRPNHRATCPSPRHDAGSPVRVIDPCKAVSEVKASSAPLAILRALGTWIMRRPLRVSERVRGEQQEGRTLGQAMQEVAPRSSDHAGSRPISKSYCPTNGWTDQPLP